MVQGLAAGVILYVVFTELLPKARLLGGGGGGALQVAAMLGGFLLFLPVIYLRELSPTSRTSSLTLASPDNSIEQADSALPSLCPDERLELC